MFTQKFIDEKFIPFIQKLEQIASSSFSGHTSPYSQAMVQEVIEIGEFLLTNPDRKTLQAKQADIKEKFAHLDAQTGTYAPAVFNDQSQALAIEVERLLEDIKEEDIQSGLRVILKAAAGSDFLRFIRNVIDYIKINITIYDKLVEAQTLNDKYRAITKDATDGIEAFYTLEQRAKKISETEIESLQEDYAAIVPKLLQKVSQEPYLRWAIGSKYKNSESPFAYDPQDLGSAGHRARFLKDMLGIEKRMNASLKCLQVAPMTQVYDCCVSQTQATEAVNLDDQYAEFITEMQQQLQSYKAGDHLRLWFKPDAEKVKFFEALFTSISTQDADDAVGYRVMKAYAFLLDTVQKHQAYILARPDLSAGKLTELLNKNMQAALDIFKQVTEVNDPSFLKELESINYEEQPSAAPRQ